MSAPIIMRPWPRWLRLVDAIHYSGMGRDRLKSLARQGRVVGFPDPEDRRGCSDGKGEGARVFARESLDAYRLAQAGQGPVRVAVLASRQRMGL